MIFATVGTQLPFDRLLLGLDTWAAANPGIPVLAQAGASKRRFRHIETVGHLSQADFRDRFETARLVVAHAGMGTILSAAELGKPLILMPRRAKFGEHRNDHQQDTALEMARLTNVTVVEDGEALHTELDLALARGFEAQCMLAPARRRSLPPDGRDPRFRLERARRIDAAPRLRRWERGMTRATILIPAHDEAAVIGRTLWYLSRGLPLDGFRVVVIANGCTDATAARARAALPQAHVIETPRAGKCHALNLGYAVADPDAPVICLDADLDVTAEALTALLAPLGQPGVLAACGKMDVSTTDVSRAVRTFYEGWRANPYFARGKFGGLFALSAAGARHASSPCRTSRPTTNTCAAVSRPARSPSCPPAASSRARPAPWRASCACVAGPCAARARFRAWAWPAPNGAAHAPCCAAPRPRPPTPFRSPSSCW
jgi:UDP-N-acetylglucosamine transferase subunit ALG13